MGVITVTRLSGQPFALNPDLIERVDVTPDTVITLSDGAKYVVSEDLDTLVELVRAFRASVIALAHQMETEAPAGRAALHVVPDPARHAAVDAAALHAVPDPVEER